VSFSRFPRIRFARLLTFPFILFTLFPSSVWALGLPIPSYDALGNRQQDTRGATVTPYTPNALNQYDQVGTTPYIYDADGNLTTDGTATYTYDAENHLTKVVKGATTTDFTYDPFGRRASKTVNGVKTTFFYDGDDLLMEGNGDGSQATARYLYGPGIDEPLEMKRGTTTSYYSADGLGSIAHLTNASGNIAERYTYEVFGKLTIKNASGTELPTSALGNRFTFTGREWDSETGLYFHRTRYRSPKTGSFLSRDPLGYLPDVNLYRYVKNNPLSFIDPFGENLVVLGGGVVAIVDVIIPGLGITVGSVLVPALGIAAAGILLWDWLRKNPPSSLPTQCPISFDVPLSPEREKHILDTHGPGRGVPGKSEFPPGLSDADIIRGVKDIINNPSNYPGGKIPTGGPRIRIEGPVGGVPTTVVVEPGGEGAITAWPRDIPRNPKPK